MTTTTREKLRLALGRSMVEQLTDQRGLAVWNESQGPITINGELDLGDLLDAILDTLREPDEGMIETVARAEYTGGGSFDIPTSPAEVFTAMIDHVRKG